MKRTEGESCHWVTRLPWSICPAITSFFFDHPSVLSLGKPIDVFREVVVLLIEKLVLDLDPVIEKVERVEVKGQNLRL